MVDYNNHNNNCIVSVCFYFKYHFQLHFYFSKILAEVQSYSNTLTILW